MCARVYCQVQVIDAQSEPAKQRPTYSLPKSEADLDQWYDSLTGLLNYSVFNGIDYVYPPNLREGHPFFGLEDWQNGKVVIDNNLYSNVLIRYDITMDAIIIYDESTGRSIRLHSVEGFMIYQSEFKFLNTITHLSPGYYQVLVDGELSLLSRREKEPYKSYYDTKVVTVYEPSVKYYLQFDGEGYAFNGKSSISKLFPQMKKNIEAYIKASKLQIRASRPEDLISIVKYTNQLIQRSTYKAFNE